MSVLQKMFHICSPSLLFLILSIIILLFSFYQNISFHSAIVLGKTRNELPMTSIVYISSGILIVIWTFLIDRMCKFGYTKLSWSFFILPLLFIIAVIALLIFMQGFSLSMKINDGLEFHMNINHTP
jgi:hypothetical protein